jgi:hypothetical protein
MGKKRDNTRSGKRRVGSINNDGFYLIRDRPARRVQLLAPQSWTAHNTLLAHLFSVMQKENTLLRTHDMYAYVHI